MEGCYEKGYINSSKFSWSTVNSPNEYKGCELVKRSTRPKTNLSKVITCQIFNVPNLILWGLGYQAPCFGRQ